MLARKVMLLHPASDFYGSSKVAIQIVELLIKSGHEVHLFLPYEGPLSEFMKKKGAIVNHVNLAVLRRRYFNFLGLFNRLEKFIFAFKSLKKYAVENQINLIYSNTTVVWVGAFLGKRTGIRHISHIHEIPVANKLYIKMVSYMLKSSERIVAVSEGVKDYWSKHIPEQKIVRVYNGFNFKFDINRKTDNEKHIIISIGRIHPLKGHNYLIDIAKLVTKVEMKIEFWIVGSPFLGYEEYAQDLKNKVSEYNLDEVINFLGERDDIHDLLNNADILIHPSINPDSLPTSILEAFYFGVPVIATDILGANEIIKHGENGLLIPLEDPVNASITITNLLKDKEQLLKLSKKGKEVFESTFSINQFEGMMNAIIENET